MQWLTPSHTQAFALADGEVLNAVVLTHHLAISQHNLTGPLRQVGIQERLHRAVMVGQAEILAFWFFGGAQTQSRGFGAGVGFGELA